METLPLIYRLLRTTGLQRLTGATARCTQRSSRKTTCPIFRGRSGVQLGLCSISNYSTALELLREKPPADRDYRSTVHFSSSLALAHMLLAAFDVPTIIPEDGDCLELLVAESERRFSEVLTGKKATTVHLPYPFPPSDERKTSGIPQNLIREILKALNYQRGNSCAAEWSESTRS